MGVEAFHKILYRDEHLNEYQRCSIAYMRSPRVRVPMTLDQQFMPHQRLTPPIGCLQTHHGLSGFRSMANSITLEISCPASPTHLGCPPVQDPDRGVLRDIQVLD
jgi:hypothetical protein